MRNNRFIQHVQIVEDTETGAKFVIDQQNVCSIVTKLLNELNDENVKIKKIITDRLEDLMYECDYLKKIEDTAVNPAHTKKQIELHDAIIMELLRIQREITK